MSKLWRFQTNNQLNRDSYTHRTKECTDQINKNMDGSLKIQLINIPQKTDNAYIKYWAPISSDKDHNNSSEAFSEMNGGMVKVENGTAHLVLNPPAGYKDNMKYHPAHVNYQLIECMLVGDIKRIYTDLLNKIEDEYISPYL
jgi:hypothetical protein